MATEVNDIAFQAGDEADTRLSVRNLYQLYHRPLLAWLRQRLSIADDADDVAQETFIRLLKYEGASNILCHKSMLYKVAANAACDQERMGRTRRRNLYASIEDEELDFPSQEPSVERIVEGEEAYRNTCRKIAKLPPKCQQVFLLSRVHGMTYPQIAAHCNISIKMVEKHVSHALLVLLKA
jgi:RNA polymerase sigma-70 factor (ECF subfamily)